MNGTWRVKLVDCRAFGEGPSLYYALWAATTANPPVESKPLPRPLLISSGAALLKEIGL